VATLRLEHSLLDVVDVAVQANLADVDLLFSLFDEAAAGVLVVVGQLLFQLADGEPVGDQLVGIDADLILAGLAAEAGDVDDAGHGFELLFQGPVFQRL
jgi:hypothetical protein